MAQTTTTQGSPIDGTAMPPQTVHPDLATLKLSKRPNRSHRIVGPVEAMGKGKYAAELKLPSFSECSPLTPYEDHVPFYTPLMAMMQLHHIATAMEGKKVFYAVTDVTKARFRKVLAPGEKANVMIEATDEEPYQDRPIQKVRGRIIGEDGTTYCSAEFRMVGVPVKRRSRE